MAFLAYIGCVYKKSFDLTTTAIFTATYAIMYTGVGIGNNINLIPDIH